MASCERVGGDAARERTGLGAAAARGGEGEEGRAVAVEEIVDFDSGLQFGFSRAEAEDAAQSAAALFDVGELAAHEPRVAEAGLFSFSDGGGGHELVGEVGGDACFQHELKVLLKFGEFGALAVDFEFSGRGVEIGDVHDLGHFLHFVASCRPPR